MAASIPKRKFKLNGKGGKYKKMYTLNANGAFIIPKHISSKLNNKETLLLSVEEPNVIRNEIKLQNLFAKHKISPLINSDFVKCNHVVHNTKTNTFNTICKQNAFFYVEKMTPFQKFRLKNKNDIPKILNSFIEKSTKLANLGYFNLDTKEENMVIKTVDNEVVNRFIKRCKKLEKRNVFVKFENKDDNIMIQYKVKFSKTELFLKFLKRIEVLSNMKHVMYNINPSTRIIHIFKRKNYEIFFIDTDPYFYLKLKTNSNEIQRANRLMSLFFIIFNDHKDLFPKGTRLLTMKNINNKEVLLNYLGTFLSKNGYMSENRIIISKVRQDIINLHNAIIESKNEYQFDLSYMINYYLLPIKQRNSSLEIVNDFILKFQNIMREKI